MTMVMHRWFASIAENWDLYQCKTQFMHRTSCIRRDNVAAFKSKMRNILMTIRGGDPYMLSVKQMLFWRILLKENEQ